MDRLKPLHCFDESLAAFAREIEVGTKKKRGKKKNKAVEASQCVRHAELLLCCPKANRAVFHSAHDLRRSCREPPFFEVRHLNYTAEVC